MRGLGRISEVVTGRMRQLSKARPLASGETPRELSDVEQLLFEWERAAATRTPTRAAVPADSSYLPGEHSNSFRIEHNGFRLTYTVQYMPEWSEIEQLISAWNPGESALAIAHRAETGAPGSIVQHHRLADALFGSLAVVPVAVLSDALREGAGSIQWIPGGFTRIAEPFSAALPVEQGFAIGVLDWLMRSQRPPTYLTDGKRLLATNHRCGAMPGEVAVTVSPLAYRFLNQSAPPVIAAAVRAMDIDQVVERARVVMPVLDVAHPLFMPVSVDGLRKRLVILRYNGGRITSDDGPVVPI